MRTQPATQGAALPSERETGSPLCPDCGAQRATASLSGSAEAIVDLAVIAYNTALLAKAAGGARLMAVVKADGFGHGAVQVARTALASGASWLGVTSPAEALALRHHGITAPILMWLYGSSEDLAPILAANIDASVASMEQLSCVAAAATLTGRVAAVHLKIDTGLARGGALAAEWPSLTAAACEVERAGLIKVVGIWSHLGNAEDVADPRLREQLRLFSDALTMSRAAELAPTLRHVANSAALLQIPEARFDLVRAGVALYGVEPVPGRCFGLRPAMTLRSQIILTKRVPAGTWVSYGRLYLTQRETTLALVPLGFADGVPRVAWRQASVAINGVRCKVAGRITMDQFVVDAGETDVMTGDVAVLFGPGDAGEPTVSEWAEWAGTNPHEILTRIGPRVPRRFLSAPS
ncbi:MULTISPECIES: alanine racemase [Rhodomicrobium]|uniref:alanine racemase n=1 Tax=Rhodomicrobium TaxID=1068 RepID=UPI000B4B4078|nr:MULTISPECIES: alanine racemase [Rhodomicrobium]